MNKKIDCFSIFDKTNNTIISENEYIYGVRTLLNKIDKLYNDNNRKNNYILLKVIDNYYNINDYKYIVYNTENIDSKVYKVMDNHSRIYYMGIKKKCEKYIKLFNNDTDINNPMYIELFIIPISEEEKHLIKI